MLLRVCAENKTHEKPRIMGWKICDNQGITHGICEECAIVIRKEIAKSRTEREQLNRERIHQERL